VTDPTFMFINEEIWYRVGAQLLGVRRDGTGAPRVVKDGGFARVIGFAPDQTIIYSKTPADLYIYGAGDGWMGDWKFMERGLGPFFSGDGKRLRWLEHTAQSSGVGDLMSALVPGGVGTRLARNVLDAYQMSDGRLIALANRSSPGTWNRIIVVDEEAGTAG